MGEVERDGWMVAEVIPEAEKATLRDAVNRNVERAATVLTDELMSYGLLTPDGYKHGTVKHGAKEFAYYDSQQDVTHHTNTFESFWRLFKNSVRSTHIHVSAKYMDCYLREFTFRANHPKMKNAMFDLLIASF